MTSFKITDDFYLDKAPFKIISGAIHYFRVVPDYWRDRLEKLKLMGCNTVETYVPWNLHEPQEDTYHFSGQGDIRRFILTAQEVGLYVILRPSPYICAEWEFGGLPYWLLNDPQLKLRFDYPPFMAKINRYFDHLFEQCLDLQIQQGGPIIMMQVENEYGGYANDHGYMKKMADLMQEKGVRVPLVTSDGPWGDMLENGSLPEIALPTINCGSDVATHFKRLREFHGQKRPLMVMEFWIGWFDAWGDAQHHQTTVEDAANELAAILAEGSVNIYMFHGGTNFGFTSGANYYEKLAPDVTSYDYDAPLSEAGDFTPKYHAFKEVISRHTAIPDFELSTVIKKKDYGTVTLANKVSLFSVLENISHSHQSNYPLSMEALGQGTGYVYYQSDLGKARPITDFRLINVMDRASIFINEERVATQYDLEIGEKIAFDLQEPTNQLGILVENMGRVNYSVKMNHQHKGIKDGVIVNGAFQSNWRMYPLPMDNLEQIDFTQPWLPNTPSFYRFEFEVEEIGDTFVDLTDWGKGFVTVNGHNIGRFWNKGPQKRLYLPGPLLKVGLNELVIFETEGVYGEHLSLIDQPDLG